MRSKPDTHEIENRAKNKMYFILPFDCSEDTD